jgi:hypothetical protein
MGRLALLALAAALVAAAFFVGLQLGAAGAIGFHPPTMTGDATPGEKVVSIEVGGTTYGASQSVSWTDASGSLHEDGWPDCLAAGVEARGLRFTGAMVWHGSSGMATILWVDCQGR